MWLSTSVRCAAASGPESEVDRTVVDTGEAALMTPKAAISARSELLRIGRFID